MTGCFSGSIKAWGLKGLEVEVQLDQKEYWLPSTMEILAMNQVDSSGKLSTASLWETELVPDFASPSPGVAALNVSLPQ